MSNTLFRIAFGDYELTLDRKTLHYSLVETKTQTTWAQNLSLGWIEVKHRETGTITRHQFGDLKCISLSEKASAAGKRILFGLDYEGVPVDVYVTCAEKEIQLTVEAFRDTKDYEVGQICFFPNLIRLFSNNSRRYTIFPFQEGALAYNSLRKIFSARVWSDLLFAPFISMVKNDSCVVLITDSAYAKVDFSMAYRACDWVYDRDPERRRLDMRLVVIPNGNHISAARVYREKLVGERNHITLRKKMREKPYLQKVIEEGLPITEDNTKFFAFEPLYLQPNAWESISDNLDIIEKISEENKQKDCLISAEIQDWNAIAVDVWQESEKRNMPSEILYSFSPIPLLSVIYHDSVIMPIEKFSSLNFLLALRNLTIIKDYKGFQSAQKILQELYKRTFMTFMVEHSYSYIDADAEMAYMYMGEEAIYSDKTHVVINKSTEFRLVIDEDHENVSNNITMTLPPLGFYARHKCVEAFDALQIGERVFSERAWRLRIARDDKPLEESQDIEEFVYPVPQDQSE
jgi:hypothetical protein